MPETKYKMDLDNAMLAYLYDPDDGMAAEIVATLNAMSAQCDGLEDAAAGYRKLPDHQKVHVLNILADYEARLEVAEAQLEFYTDVWQKVQARTPSAEVVNVIIEAGPELVEAKSPYFFSARSEMASEIALFEFLVSCGQHKYADVIEQRNALVDDLLSRGWHKDVR